MSRTFTLEDQLTFASLSGDYNPMHVDPVAARRFLFGHPVVHGIHALLWALHEWLRTAPVQPANQIRLQAVKVQFRNPILLNEPVELDVRLATENHAKLEVTSNGSRLMSVTVAFAPVGHTTGMEQVNSTLPQRGPCRDRTVGELSTVVGSLPLHLDPAVAAALFPETLRRLPVDQVAALLATTRLVGMEAPGLHSIFTGLDLTHSNGTPDVQLHYEAKGYDQRFSLLSLQVTAPGLAGEVSAALRPPPREQASWAQLRQQIGPREFVGQRALVVGGSRGLGEVAVKELAAGGADVRFTYHRGEADARRLTDEIIGGGGSAACFGYDVLKDALLLPTFLGGWSPTLLCYFATPFIATTAAGRFSQKLFGEFCSYYIDGFAGTFRAALLQGNSLVNILHPSSCFLDDLPVNMMEYCTAKSASETLCRLLEKSYKGVRFHFPRLPRLATDQTASLLQTENVDSCDAILAILRQILNPPLEGREP